LKQRLIGYIWLFGISGTIIFFDQLSKSWIRSTLAMGEVWQPWDWLTPYARIVHWYNTGVAFGMFQGLGPVFKILPIIVAILIIYYYPQIPKTDWYIRVALSLQLGGAIGNLIDRFMIGHVTDFISIGNFPVFNIADSSITVGVGVLLLGVWLEDRKSKAFRKIDSNNYSSEQTTSQG